VLAQAQVEVEGWGEPVVEVEGEGEVLVEVEVEGWGVERVFGVVVGW
jgi:hypothetical protein